MIDYTLSAQQIQVIDALSSGATMTDAAEQAGVHRNTVANWRRNALPFQYALAHAQYDRALVFREKCEALTDLAFQTLQQILTDPNAPAGVRLKAALAIINTASTPPEPKKQVMIDIEKIKVVRNPEPQVLNPEPTVQNMHKDAQPCTPSPQDGPPQNWPQRSLSLPQRQKVQTLLPQLSGQTQSRAA